MVLRCSSRSGARAHGEKREARRERRPRWNEALLQGVRDSKLGPPMVARALAIAHTCIYDAWAAYDHKAVGTRLGGSLRRPPAERTLPNNKQAISFAAYRAAGDLFPGSISSVFDPLMQTLGYDPGDLSTDTSRRRESATSPPEAVLDFRHRDGANQLGDEPGGIPGVPYSDYTGLHTRERPDGHPRRRSTRRPSTTPAHGSRCATSTAAAPLSRRGSSAPSGSACRRSPSPRLAALSRPARPGTDRRTTAPRRRLCSTSAPGSPTSRR